MLGSLGILFIVGGASYVLGSRFRHVPGPIIALIFGALMGVGGPFGANILWNDGSILPPEPLGSLRVLGAILLMWGAGIEMDVALLRKHDHVLRAAGIGILGGVFSAGMTWLLLDIGVLGHFGETERFGLAIVSAASAIPVLIAIVQTLGKLRHPITATALTAALIVDLILVALIPMVRVDTGGDSPISHFGRSFVYLLAMIVLAEGPWRFQIRRLGARFLSLSPNTAATLAVGFGITIAVTALAGQVGVELLPAALGWGIGSKQFFFPDQSTDRNPFAEAFFAFVASYFALAGAMMDLRQVSLIGGFFGLLMIATKVLGGLPFGRDGLRAGLLLAPRGAVDLVLAVSLFSSGVLSPEGYALAVTMIATTTIGAALLARFAFR